MPTLTVSCNNEATIINPDYGGLGASFGGGELAASDNSRFSSGAVLNSLNEEYDYIGGTFDLSSLPAGALINGITVTMERRQDGGTAIISDEHLRLSIDGSTFVGDDKATGLPWSATDEQVVYGGPTDLWGRVWTAAEIKTATFGVFNAPKVTTAGTATAAEWDWLQISIRYNESGGGGSSPGTGPVAGTIIGNGDIMYSEVYIDEAHTFTAALSAGTGAATDATGSVSYRVYEDETTTPILTGTMAVLDDSNTTGLYSEQITLSAANGFEVGKRYTVWVSATVSAVAQAGIVDRFIVRRNYWTEVPTEITERADTPWEMLHQVWKRFFNKMTMNRDSGVVILYNNDGTTSEVEGTNSTSGATETRGAMS